MASGVAQLRRHCYSAEEMINGQEITRGAAVLAAGGLVAFPTETVYGLGADATSDDAVARVFAAKGRPQFNPLIAHVAAFAAAQELGIFPNDAKRLADVFWPGALTLVVPRQADCPVSLLASSGLPSIALRVPSHAVAQELLKAFGKPIAAPSANRSGRISPTTAAHVRAELGDAVDMILDGGPSQVGLESTVVSFLDGRARLLRPGGIVRQDLEQVLGYKLDDAEAGPLHAPGQLESHYAPRAALRLNVEKPLPHEVYLGFGAFAHGPVSLSPTGNLMQAAANLFRLLHEVDAAGADHIAVAPIPGTGLGEAINDRLKRAAAPRS